MFWVTPWQPEYFDMHKYKNFNWLITVIKLLILILWKRNTYSTINLLNSRLFLKTKNLCSQSFCDHIQWFQWLQLAMHHRYVVWCHMPWSSQKCLGVMIISTKAVCAHCIYNVPENSLDDQWRCPPRWPGDWWWWSPPRGPRTPRRRPAPSRPRSCGGPSHPRTDNIPAINHVLSLMSRMWGTSHPTQSCSIMFVIHFCGELVGFCVTEAAFGRRRMVGDQFDCVSLGHDDEVNLSCPSWVWHLGVYYGCDLVLVLGWDHVNWSVSGKNI